MTSDQYRAFIKQLTARLEADQRVVGLVALGSMAAVDYQPDQWSDHDFFVVVESGKQDEFRNDLSWLPDGERIVFSFRETQHGIKVVYDDGHLLEFAVFDEPELALARVNRFRILLDRGEIAAWLDRVREATVVHTTAQSKDHRKTFGQFLTNILVGVGRYRRGERLSGHMLVKAYALGHLLALLSAHVPAEGRELLDDLDASRRFEAVYPEIGMKLVAILSEPVPAAARGLLGLTAEELGPSLDPSSSTALDVVARFVD